MTTQAVAAILIFAGLLTALAIPLGGWMARVLSGEKTLIGRVLGPIERVIYRVARVRVDDEMTWQRYAFAVLVFNVAGVLVVYAMQRLQASLPLNPAGLGAVPPEVSFNTAVSFATNTNWQVYGGETTMSHLVQMAGLTVQNFVSAATGIAVLLAAMRGFSRRETDRLGNFWVDLVRSTLYVLVPLSIVVALFLSQQGVVQTFARA